MKFVLGIVCLIGIGIILSPALRFRQAVRACAAEHQDSLDATVMQSQGALADRQVTCSSSFEEVTAWDLCLMQAGNALPARVRDSVRPVLMNILMFVRDQKKDIGVLKREHDERCKGYPDVMFFPPDVE